MHLGSQDNFCEFFIIKVLTSKYSYDIINHVKKYYTYLKIKIWGKFNMRLSTRQLEELIEIKREELNRLYSEQGLNDFTLAKSQELDVLITKAQIIRLEEEKEKIC